MVELFVEVITLSLSFPPPSFLNPAAERFQCSLLPTPQVTTAKSQVDVGTHTSNAVS